MSEATSGETALFHCKTALSRVDLTSLKVTLLLHTNQIGCIQRPCKNGQCRRTSRHVVVRKLQHGQRDGRQQDREQCSVGGSWDKRELMSTGQGHLEHQWPAVCRSRLGGCLVAVSNGMTVP